MTHKDLDVWKNSILMVTEIYKITNSFPKSEMYGLTSQIRRSAVSIPSNIAEGAARLHTKEFIRFLYISLGSIAEIETQLIIAGKLNYINSSDFESFENKIKLIRNQLISLIKALKNKSDKVTA